MAINEQDSEALRAELERVGLRMSHMPGGGLVASAGAMRELLARLRSTAPGVTWRDVFPDLAAHWEPGRPETWTAPYRPFGPYDYQELPTGPAVHVHWSRDMSPGFLDDLLGLREERDGRCTEPDSSRSVTLIGRRSMQCWFSNVARQRTRPAPSPSGSTTSRVCESRQYLAPGQRHTCPDSLWTTAPCVRPNKRLKLTGGDRSKGRGVLCPWQARTVVHYPCAGARVARSLSAIR